MIALLCVQRTSTYLPGLLRYPGKHLSIESCAGMIFMMRASKRNGFDINHLCRLAACPDSAFSRAGPSRTCVNETDGILKGHVAARLFGPFPSHNDFPRGAISKPHGNTPQ